MKIDKKKPKAPKILKKRKPKPVADETPKVKDVLDGVSTRKYVIDPLPPSDLPGQHGTVVLVPKDQDYYYALAYVAGEEGLVCITLPEVQGIVVMDLPDGFLTDPDDIMNAIATQVGGTPPDIVGPGKSP